MFVFHFDSDISKEEIVLLRTLSDVLFDVLESYREMFELSNESKKITKSKSKDFGKLDCKQIELLKKYDSAFKVFQIKVTTFLEKIVNGEYSVKI